MQCCVVATALVVLLIVQATVALPPPMADRNLPDDYSDNTLDHLLGRTDKRACVRRGGGCDSKPNDCCENSTCRCNLWGTNCRCERAGLFQQWGRK